MTELSKVVTIDGPAASGKGTVAQSLAERLEWNLLDSGVLYRVVGYIAEERRIATGDGSHLASVLASDIKFEFSRDESRRPSKVRDFEWISVFGFANDARIFHNGLEITAEVRSASAASMASEVAAEPEVRRELIKVQRQQRVEPGLIADGRDMGTVVFADADLKIFLVSSLEVRVARRLEQLKEGGTDATFDSLFEAMRKRDERDATRNIAPMVPALDAVEIDNSELSIEQTIDTVMRIARDRDLI